MVSAHISFRLRAVGVRAGLWLFLPLLLEDLEVPDRYSGRVTPGQEHVGDVLVRDGDLTTGTGLKQLDKRFPGASVTVEKVAGKRLAVIGPYGNVAAVLEGQLYELIDGAFSPLACQIMR